MIVTCCDNNYPRQINIFMIYYVINYLLLLENRKLKSSKLKNAREKEK